VPLFVNHQGPYWCEIDTGSTNLMVPGDLLTCPNCYKPNGISPNASMGLKFTVKYGSGRILHARTYRAEVEPYNSSTPGVHQTFGVIIRASGNLNSDPILGMTQQSNPINHYRLTTYMNSLLNAHVINKLRFMIAGCPRLQSTAELVVGGIDPRLKNTIPVTVPLILNKLDFFITPEALGIAGGHQLGVINFPVEVDSGTADTIIPARLFHPLIRVLNQHLPMPQAFWYGKSFSLSNKQINQLPAIVLRFAGNKMLLMKPTAYIIPSASKPGKYVFMISKSYGKHMVLGDALMSSYAVEFNHATESMSFYPNRSLCR